MLSSSPWPQEAEQESQQEQEPLDIFRFVDDFRMSCAEDEDDERSG